MLVEGFFDPATSTVSYILADKPGGTAAIIDPVLDFDPKNGRLGTASADRLLDRIAELGLDLAWILETHAHADHLSAAHHLRTRTGAPVAIGAHIDAVQRIFAPLFEAHDVRPDGSAFDRLLHNGERLPLGDLEIMAMHTPGHTPACMSYVAGDAAFVGDTLFMPDYGTARADFPGGDARMLHRSIRRILDLLPETRIFVGHDYPPAGRAPAWETTVATQRVHNIHVHDGIDEAAFVAMRETRDATLAAPALLLPSLQVNIRAGALPPPSPKGRVFLKLPVNAL
jgi:glyoxylase-like metal-dependent hydrolase (beta-lactamase superfamily II)